MSRAKSESAQDTTEKAPDRRLTPEAQRALAEAEARRQSPGPGCADRPAEHGGREGPDPVRFGDWEKNGIVSDF